MLAFLAAEPLISLILILVVGLAVGKIKIKGVSLGASAALFVAIGISALNPNIRIPDLIWQLGLALFVYAIGLSAGSQFFHDFKGRGWRLNLYVVVILTIMAGITFGMVKLFRLDSVVGAGMYAGALTSTPGMASIVSALEDIDPTRAEAAVVGYSLVYPGAVVAFILIASIGAIRLKIDHQADARAEGLITDPLEWRIIRINAPRGTIGELIKNTGQPIACTRVISSDGHHRLADPDEALYPGMEILVNGTAKHLSAATQILGEQVVHDIPAEDIDFLRVTVSSPQVVGRTIADIDAYNHGFTIARLRRGDVEMVPRPDDVLHYSDRLRIVAAPQDMRKALKIFGDSERRLADLDLLPFMIGLLCGLALGSIPIPLLGGDTIHLGPGGGPIIAGLIFGALGRTATIPWQIPFHANRTIFSLGSALFLAGVGTRAGAGFRAALTDPESLKYIGLGFLITVLMCIVTAFSCMKLFDLHWDEAMGVAAGVTTNSASLAYLNVQTDTDLGQRGYAAVYPTALVCKIIISHLLVLLLL
ncbi:aspartate:alanine exchanger family transporter [Corynebacterium caspium]|uniref:aspartate:alanine exchanger family transporter n=1 Tax=Corynebacterium caspium TaxID=234828 RepID=UPI00036A4A51|nr:aspartate:alanine exchanger family transporter [Corynebacterium caspium]WKD59796.1 Aspartate/alanine antiporter [Corynebacterium caspium DSM 44850]